jgi:pentatricopeptide repeat protein
VASDQWESVLEILEIMKRKGLKQERSSYRACLQECFEVGNGASAKEILAAMEKALVKPDPSDIALTVAALCCRNDNNHATPGWWRRALGLLTTTSMKCKSDKDVIPVEAYNAVLKCMGEERQWKEAVRLLRLMEEGSSDKTTSGRKKYIGYHPAPDISTYREVIECALGGNQADIACRVLYSMKERGIKVRKRRHQNDFDDSIG